MQSSEIRRKFLEFYQSRGHAVIPSAPIVPENDPTTLFNSSGMQPLVPYLLGQTHPAGKRLVNSQKSFRAPDIEEVGDNRHTTFFEMLGNWSLGDYFKKEQLPWIFEFLTKELGLDPQRLCVSVFEGTKDVPRDEESVEIWKSLGFSDDRIFFYGAKKNWWSRSGEPEKMPPGEPGGPDSEMFFDFGPERKIHESSQCKDQPCHPNCDCGRYLEIANSVFMQYVKKDDGTLAELPNKNVDFGGGLERLTAATIDNPDIFQTDMFTSLYRYIEALTGKKYGAVAEETRAMRIICDHVKAAVMMSADGVIPSNKTQGYVLRRLIRRSLLYGRQLGLTHDFLYVGKLVAPVAEIYKEAYPEVLQQTDAIAVILQEEALRFGKSLERGLSEIEKVKTLDGKIAFYLYESYGFPWEMTEEIAREKGQQVARAQFEEEFKKHQELSRTAARGMFKGGLADHGEKTTQLHTATHLLHAALRKVLGEHVGQKGSNITAERLRFDFSHPGKLTNEELEGVEGLVNEKIKEDLAVTFVVMDKEEALNSGALAFFGERYGDKVKVYSIGSFSKEICGGPHVSFTGTLGHFTIVKGEALGAGVRRIYAMLQ
jgi:alanyl-tRNA synthetase